MSTRRWPTLEVTIQTPPSLGEWEVFLAMAQAELQPAGTEEIAPPGAIYFPDGIPAGVRFFLPAEDQLDEGSAPGLAHELERLVELYIPSAGAQVTLVWLEDRDWGSEWRRHFRITRVGQRLYVAPPWDTEFPPDAPSDALLIQIDPGQAFGTGSHETTQLCLRLLESHLRPGDCLLDVGTGSGILCIGALLLGAAAAIGVEYDPVCEENFLLNAKLNGTADRVRFVLSADPAEGLARALAQGSPSPALTVCNMLSERFYPLLPALRSVGTPLLLSGFLTSERSTVLEALEKARFRPDQEFQLVEWGAVLAKPV